MPEKKMFLGEFFESFICTLPSKCKNRTDEELDRQIEMIMSRGNDNNKSLHQLPTTSASAAGRSQYISLFAYSKQFNLVQVHPIAVIYTSSPRNPRTKYWRKPP